MIIVIIIIHSARTRAAVAARLLGVGRAFTRMRTQEGRDEP